MRRSTRSMPGVLTYPRTRSGESPASPPSSGSSALAGAGPKTCARRCSSRSAAENAKAVRPSCARVKATSGYPSARVARNVEIRANSAAGARRYSRRAGTFAKSARTLTRVPCGAAIGSGCETLLPCASTIQPTSLAAVREIRRTCATAAILASPSPRKPSETIRSRSPACASLLVACRAKARCSSAASMPAPSSLTSIASRPPRVTETTMRVAPASSAFSTSSFTTESGRSTTSPAAIAPTVVSSRRRITLRYTATEMLSPRVARGMHILNRLP